SSHAPPTGRVAFEPPSRLYYRMARGRTLRAQKSAAAGGLSVEGEGRREVPVGVGLRLQIGGRLLGGGNGVGAGDEAARRRLLAGDHDERPRELGRVAGLPAVLGLPELELLRSALVVVRDGR